MCNGRHMPREVGDASIAQIASHRNQVRGQAIDRLHDSVQVRPLDRCADMNVADLHDRQA